MNNEFIRRIGCWFCLLAISCSFLCACAPASDTNNTAPNNTSPSADTTETTEPEKETDPEEEGLKPADVTIDNVVFYDDHDITMTATKLRYSRKMPEITVVIENQSAYSIRIRTEDIFVNGYMVPGGIFYDVPAGETAETTFTFQKEEYELTGITVISRLDFHVTIWDAETDTLLFDETPAAIQTSAVDYVQNVDDSGDVLYEKDGLRIIYQGCVLKKEHNRFLHVLVENTSTEAATLEVRNLILNGLVINLYPLYLELPANTRSVTRWSVYDTYPVGINKEEQLQNIGFDVKTSISNTTEPTQTRIRYAWKDANYVQEVDDSGLVIYNQQNLEIIYQKATVSDDTLIVQLLMRNHGGADHNMVTEHCYINGQQADVNTYLHTIPTGTSCLAYVYVYGYTDPSQITSFRVVYVSHTDAYGDVETDEISLS